MSVLQPLDIFPNKSFKTVHKLWMKWMLFGLAMLIEGGNIQKPDLSLVC